ncbi:MAG: ISL3 family transposase [Planctomycetes bacterium]|nr:ISL3 family transposase [Planctomycetota bacterium]
MRTVTLFRRLLGVTSLFVESVGFETVGLVLDVRPRWVRPRCGRCERKCGGYDRRPRRRWRHLSWGRTPIWLRYAPRRVLCSKCGIRNESVPWAEPDSRFTKEFEELAAYLAQVTDKTQVTKQLGISWRTVGRIVERIASRRLDPERLEGLRRIGIDEFGYRRRQRYITIVVDHDQRRVVWASKGNSSKTLREFFRDLGEERCETIKCVTVDMASAWTKPLGEFVPQAQVVFDRFHVQALASDAVDEVRRAQLRELRGTEEGRAIFKSRFALLRRPWDLRKTDREKLSVIQKNNVRLYRAYLLKETLAKSLDYKQPWRAERSLREWLAWASRSRLTPFVKTARTIRRHLDGILAYVHERLTNGIVEGFNNRLRMITRRAFGFHSASSLIGMLFLCCGGIQLDPPLPGPT